MDTENGRRKLEYSAASWQQRASLLRSLEARTHKRMILDKTEWDQADADERLYPSDQDIDDVRV